MLACYSTSNTLFLQGPILPAILHPCVTPAGLLAQSAVMCVHNQQPCPHQCYQKPVSHARCLVFSQQSTWQSTQVCAQQEFSSFLSQCYSPSSGPSILDAGLLNPDTESPQDCITQCVCCGPCLLCMKYSGYFAAQSDASLPALAIARSCSQGSNVLQRLQQLQQLWAPCMAPSFLSSARGRLGSKPMAAQPARACIEQAAHRYNISVLTCRMCEQCW
jgi:hypothetical protein